jgi:hypothetical protein
MVLIWLVLIASPSPPLGRRLRAAEQFFCTALWCTYSRSQVLQSASLAMFWGSAEQEQELEPTQGICRYGIDILALPEGRGLRHLALRVRSGWSNPMWRSRLR